MIGALKERYDVENRKGEREKTSRQREKRGIQVDTSAAAMPLVTSSTLTELPCPFPLPTGGLFLLRLGCLTPKAPATSLRPGSPTFGGPTGFSNSAVGEREEREELMRLLSVG